MHDTTTEGQEKVTYIQYTDKDQKGGAQLV